MYHSYKIHAFSLKVTCKKSYSSLLHLKTVDYYNEFMFLFKNDKWKIS